MRVIDVTVVMIAILAIGGLTLRHMPSAAARHEQAQIGPHALVDFWPRGVATPP